MYNETIITPSSYLSISVKGEGADKPYIKKNNTFVNIFYDTCKELVGKRENFRFDFTNNIPFSRGLGSSSSVIVGAIAAAFHACGLAVVKEQVLNRALLLENHPDNITPAVHGGFTCAVVEDGKVVMIRKNMPSHIKAVVVIPNTAMSTDQSRQSLPKQYKMSDAVFNLSHSALLTAAFMSEDWHTLRVASQDRMHEEIRMGALAQLFNVRKTAYANGALMSTLSGSGSSFLSLVEEQHTRRLADALAVTFPEFRVVAMDLDNSGFEIA
jgi:homoserine kinase